MRWELLVTEGHVRAARLRRLTLPSIVVAVASIVLGWLILRQPVIVSVPYMRDPLAALQQKLAALRQPVNTAFFQGANVQVPYSDLERLAPESQLLDVRTVLKDSLAATGKPPVGLGLKAAASPKEFWLWDWPRTQIIYLEKGELRAFGAIVLSTPPNSQRQGGSRPVRWLAVFRRFGAEWDDVAIRSNGFVAPAGEKTASPDQILLSLRTLMDMPETTQ